MKQHCEEKSNISSISTRYAFFSFSCFQLLYFRIEPRVSLYLRQVVEDLVASKKVDLKSTYPSLRKNGIPGDFRFIIIHRVYYPESSANRQQNLLMSFYALISKIGIDEPKALGLDTSMVVVERVPLIINQRNRSIRRITQIVDKKEEQKEKACL